MGLKPRRRALINMGSWLITKIAAAAEPANSASSCVMVPFLQMTGSGPTPL